VQSRTTSTQINHYFIRKWPLLRLKHTSRREQGPFDQTPRNPRKSSSPKFSPTHPCHHKEQIGEGWRHHVPGTTTRSRSLTAADHHRGARVAGVTAGRKKGSSGWRGNETREGSGFYFQVSSPGWLFLCHRAIPPPRWLPRERNCLGKPPRV
jgi:hypothetical protein